MSDLTARVVLFNTSSERRNSTKYLNLHVNSNEQVDAIIHKCLNLFLPVDRKSLNAVLLHHGLSLDPTRRLIDQAVTSDCVMQLVLKDMAPTIPAISLNASEKAFQSLTELASQRRLGALSQILQRPEQIDEVLSRSPFVVTSEMGVIYSILLHSPQLLLCLLRDPPGVKRTLLQHPALAEVTLRIIQLHKSTSPTSDNSSTSAVSLSVPSANPITSQLAPESQDFSVHQDQSLDEEEEEESEDDDAPNTGAIRSNLRYQNPAPSSGITLAQRAGSSHRSSNSRQAAISADAFRSALSAALHQPEPSASEMVTVQPPQPTAVVPPSPPALTNPRQMFGNQLAALREMGVTDEEVALQMLLATQGNLEAAINLMFG